MDKTAAEIANMWCPDEIIADTAKVALSGNYIHHISRSGKRHRLEDCPLFKEIKATLQNQKEVCAKAVERAWTPAVGGYPSGPELAKMIRELE